MRGFVTVDDETSYNEWLSEQITFKESIESASLNNNKFAEIK
jgi:heme/copper-type cytochrome/quinol oxidase subunit 2